MTMASLLAQAVSLAHDMMVGEDDPISLVVALPDGGPPVPMFIETDDTPVQSSSMHLAVDQFVRSTGARKWFQIMEARLWMPAPNARDVLVCAVHYGGLVRIQMLSILRDEQGRITLVRQAGEGRLPASGPMRAAA